MAGNGKKPTDLLNPNYRRYDLTDQANYEGDYPDGDYSNNVQKILETPGVDNLPGVFIRGRFNNERSLNATLRLMYRHKKFSDVTHQELLCCKILGSAALNGVSRLEALFAATNLLGPDMYRTALGMPKGKKGEKEEILRGSDFRRDEKPPDGGLGVNK